MIFAILLTICITCSGIVGICWLIDKLYDFEITILNILIIFLPIIVIVCGSACGIFALWTTLV